jgi:hypothetical protein
MTYTLGMKHHISYSMWLRATQAQLVFCRDMIVNIKTIFDWRTHITTHKQKQINQENDQDNSGQNDHKYSIGDLIDLHHTSIQWCKLEYTQQGLYHITHVYTNGTVHLQIGAINK